MNGVQKAVYTAAVAYGLVLGLIIPWFIPSEGHPLFQAFRLFLGNNSFAIAVAMIVAVGASIATMYVGLRSVARGGPMIWLLFMKLAVFTLLGAAAGLVGSMAFGWLGIYETPRDFFAFCAVAATVWLCAGVTGIVAMNSTPRYKQVLRARNKDRAAAAGPARKPDNGSTPPFSLSDWLTHPWGRHKLTWKHFLIVWFVVSVVSTAISLSIGATPAKSYEAFRHVFVELTKAVRNPNYLPPSDP